jgi:hypothetical protein
MGFRVTTSSDLINLLKRLDRIKSFSQMDISIEEIIKFGVEYLDAWK